ncbi:MAG: hypothetical protein HQK65_12950 [Desulfamplus sp.]|nr:hypothetical protein [Desulfamplus sp.]
MLKKTFDKLWDECFLRKYKDLKRDIPNLFINTKGKDSVYSKYQSFNEGVHQLMRDPKEVLDRHKVSAILVAAILDERPLEMTGNNTINTNPIKGYYSNEIFAYHCALQLLRQFLIADRSSVEAEKFGCYLKENPFCFPHTSEEHYTTHMAKMLFYSRTQNKFNIFLFAMLLHQIEVYTILCWKTPHRLLP